MREAIDDMVRLAKVRKWILLYYYEQEPSVSSKTVVLIHILDQTKTIRVVREGLCYRTILR